MPLIYILICDLAPSVLLCFVQVRALHNDAFGVGAHRISTTGTYDNCEAGVDLYGNMKGELATSSLSCLAAQLTGLSLPREPVLIDIWTICEELPQLSNLRHLDSGDYDLMTAAPGEFVLF